jgi:hypothetical protein
MSMRNLFTIILVGLAGVASSQDILNSKLAWTVTQLTDLNTNAVMNYQCVFKTNKQLSIAWVQDEGAFTTDITVEQVQGSWTDVGANGQVVYSVTTDGLTGTITFKRADGELSITLDLQQLSGPNLRHKYTVPAVALFN